jgi:hypothetical protein
VTSLPTLIGYLGSVLVVASLTMRSIMRLRIIGLAGALTFIVYGYLIDAWPIVLTNVVILAIHLAFLREIFTATEYFKVIEVRYDSPYLDLFLDTHGPEIEEIWPDFSSQLSDDQLALFVLRDLMPAGLFVADVEGDSTLNLRLDFVIPGYRDFKVGRYLYRKGTLHDRGFRTIVADSPDPRTIEYFSRMGFRPTTADGQRGRFCLDLEPGAVSSS